jgi:hypothetical protein
MRSLLLAKIASDLAAKRSRIFSATTRSAGSSEARGSGYHALLGCTDRAGRLCGSGVNGRRGHSLAGAVGAEDVSVEACPSGDAPVGTAAKLPPFAKTLKRAARITAKAMPAKMRSQRGPFIRRRSPRQPLLHRAQFATQEGKKIWRFWSAVAPFNRSECGWFRPTDRRTA